MACLTASRVTIARAAGHYRCPGTGLLTVSRMHESAEDLAVRRRMGIPAVQAVLDSGGRL